MITETNFKFKSDIVKSFVEDGETAKNISQNLKKLAFIINMC